MSPSRDEIFQELANVASTLADLERTRDQLEARKTALRTELAAISPTAADGVQMRGLTAPRAPQTPTEKLKLFQSLFRGRPDVFPVRFVSRKTGRAGYAPACSNKWLPEICHLRSGGKCGDCSNQAFTPVSEQLILDHLQGRHVMGVYPLLEDETCWFLAADFDNSTWQQDVTAFAETCRSTRLPVAIERSRSGNGAHAWLFFAAPISANIARRVGCYLLTETMTRRHELSMESYDRLFPNQDTMPRGGFGNLIALPLQHEPRQRGNSVFVDDQFEPFADQWAFLASLERIRPAAAEDVAKEASRTGQVIGVRIADLDDDEAAPWDRPASGQSTAARAVTGPLPSVVNAVLSQRLYVEKAGLPASLLNQIKRGAAFQNPEFYKKQRMRLSTAMTPRVISCAEELPLHVSLPRGCTPGLADLLAQHAVRLLLDDRRRTGSVVPFTFSGQLTATQKEAAQSLLKHETGIIVAPPGTGKTVLGTHLIAERSCSTLVLVHRKPLLEQWKAQLAIFLGIDEKDIGQIGGGQRKPNGRLDVAMMQSLVKKEVVDDLVRDYGHIVVDECHHVPAFSFERILSETKARYLVGLTATPQRRDGRQAITEMQLGPVRFRADAKSQAERRPFEHKLIVRETGFNGSTSSSNSIQDLYRALAGDDARNQRIVDDVLAVLQEGRSPILLTERKDHLDHLAHRLRGLVRHLIVLKGGTSAREQTEARDQLTSVPDTSERLVLATGRYVGEGFDDARLDTLFLAMPVSWKGTLIQYAGRLHRLHARKTEVRIYDYVDHEVPMLLRMFERRLTTYRAIGYARGEAPLGFGEPPPEAMVEYDPEALRHFDTTV
jgi:superfamily II DNA or RNA helicase